MWRICLILLCVCLGCAHHPRVQNPFPGVFRVAVVPFGDKTTGDDGVDPMHITDLFVNELQKVPTFEVVPIQEVIDVLGSEKIETNQPALAYALARAVHAQAVIVGDVTEYNAYYPPVLGLHCEMYAMVTGQPEMIVEPDGSSRSGVGIPFGNWLQKLLDKGKGCDTCADKSAGKGPTDQQIKQVQYEQPARPGPVQVATPVVEPWVIRHSRVFDGSNAGFVRKLQDYFFFRKDERGGEWVGYLDRVEDFHRFSCNRMIYEMLEASGGKWTPLVGIEFPMPWEPWPWR